MNRFFTNKIDHIIFWVFTVFFHGYTRLGLLEKTGANQFLLELVVRNSLLALVIYFNLLFIFPRLTSGRNFFSNILLLVGSIIFYAFLKNAHDVYLFNDVLGDVSWRFFDNTLYNISIVLFYLSFATALHLSKQWWIQRDLIRKIELEKVQAELEYLKAQLNPHFLFNSINTIYFQIEKKNTIARETLSKFSDMLRYQMYECNGQEIPIEKEITYLKNYVELQRLRKDENYDIQFFCSSESVNFKLPPLLLLPFVENAFKHVSHFSDKRNIIKIDLTKESNVFRLIVFNTKDKSQPVSENGGIGLKNVKRRLELLFNDQHLLAVVDSHETFQVSLELKLSTEQTNSHETQLSDH